MNLKLQKHKVIFVIIFFLYGCSTSTHFLKIEKNLKSYNYKKAYEELERQKHKEKDRFLYFVNKGMILHLGKQYSKSNKALSKAERISEELYTKSITGEIGAMFTNDSSLPYEGEDFEKVMINIIMALNYVQTGNIDEALVEARKVDLKLNLLNDKYKQKNIYKKDALARYISGILYEMKGKLDDALIEYRKTYYAFKEYEEYYSVKMPSIIIKDLLRLTKMLGLDEEHKKVKAQYKDIEYISGDKFYKKSELVIVTYHGFSPIKKDYFVDVEIPDDKGYVDHIRVAFPKFEKRNNPVAYAEVKVKGVGTFKSELFENISEIAVKNLKDRIIRISAKAIARASAKYLASREIVKEADKKEDTFVSVITRIATNSYKVLSEEADKRSWRTLPAEIHLTRILLKPGKYEISIRFISKHKSTIENVSNILINLKPREVHFEVFSCY